MTFALKWQKLASIPPLQPHQVCVLAVPLEIESVDLDSFKSLLSDDELRRADRFVFPADSAKFVLCRGILRRLLGFYLSTKNEAVDLCVTDHGKLHLGDQVRIDIRFNLTHSKDLAVFAFSVGQELGVDIESVDRTRATEEVAQRHFSPKERSDLARVPQPQRIEAFYRCWTRKEAYLKARGDGLSVDLASFDVSVLDESNPRLFARDSVRWEMWSLNPADGYLGAVVFETGAEVHSYWLTPHLLQDPANHLL